MKLRVLLLVTWALVGFSVWQLTRLGADFLPKFDEGSVQINVTLPGGSSLKASNEASALIDARLKTMQQSPDNPGGPILHFARRTGRDGARRARGGAGGPAAHTA